MEHAAARMSLYLGRLKVLKSGLGRKAGGKYLAMGRCGLVSCWAEVEKRFGFTALEAYTDSIRAYRYHVPSAICSVLASCMLSMFLFRWVSWEWL